MVAGCRMLAASAGLLVLGALVITAAGQKKTPPAHPIDLNHATAAQLEQVPGIGPSTARAILRFREKSGPFHSVDELRSLPGFGPKRLARMRPYLTVGPSEKQVPKSEKQKRGS